MGLCQGELEAINLKRLFNYHFDIIKLSKQKEFLPMPTKNHIFSWGIYISDLIDQNDTILLCLDSKQGGFFVLFDEASEAVANNLIENVALKFF
jgi:hypothetical protein